MATSRSQPGQGSRTLRALRRLVVWGALVAGAMAAAAARRRRNATATRTDPNRLLEPPTPGPAPAPSTGSDAARPGPARTREELYRQAQALGIKGRSKMTKAQLERAVEERGS